MGTNYYADVCVGYQFMVSDLYSALNGRQIDEENSDAFGPPDFRLEVTVPGVGPVALFEDDIAVDGEEALVAVLEKTLECQIYECTTGYGRWTGPDDFDSDVPIIIGVEIDAPVDESGYGYQSWSTERMDVGPGLRLKHLIESAPLLDALAERIERTLGIPMKDRAPGIHIYGGS